MFSHDPNSYFYDWNTQGGQHAPWSGRVVELDDETLRDGFQSPSAIIPPIEDRIQLLHLMNDLGIDIADLGFPGAGPRFAEDVCLLAREIVTARLSIQAAAAGRTTVEDIIPIVEVSQRAGLPIEAHIFMASSPVRSLVEGWDEDTMCRMARESVRFAIDHGLPVMFVTEDTVRATPDRLRMLYSEAISQGAHRICLCDTVGHATPDGVRHLITFIRGVIADLGVPVKIDWHGHRDRGLDIPNSLAAIEAGAHRVHATALGLGERVGNTPMDLLLVNLQLMGVINRDLSKLSDYCRLAAATCGVPLPANYPVIGDDAFRTATGVHADAIIKARSRPGEEFLADIVYSGVPASMVGKRQIIEVGPMSGAANVRYWLQARRVPVDERLVERILVAAKQADRLLSDHEIWLVVEGFDPRLAATSMQLTQHSLNGVYGPRHQ